MRVVITGGPCAGKTTLVRALAERGYPTVDEAAIEVIERLNSQLGVDGQKTWRRANLLEFQTLVIWHQAQLEANAPADARAVFFDRGRLDGLAYCRHFDAPVPQLLLELARPGVYHRVLVLETLSDFETRAASGRTSDLETSRALCDLIEEVYREHGFDPIRVPELDVEARVDFCLAALGLPA